MKFIIQEFSSRFYEGSGFYAPLTQANGGIKAESCARTWKLSLKYIACYALLALFSATIGFVVGRNNVRSSEVLEPPGKLSVVFRYNSTFATAPSAPSDQAWAALLPAGDGFMLGQSTISNVSAFSVFHQLHCIKTIRRDYYGMLESIRNPERSADVQVYKSPVHVAHCLDYLRQCIQCSADTNVEPVDWKSEGVTGWGFKRLCRDYSDVRKFAESRRAP